MSATDQGMAMAPELTAPGESAAGAASPGPAVALWRRAVRAVASGLDWLFGLLSLVLGLAIFSVVPLLNFVSLGYLLHASGRVATTGRLRDGLVGVRKAAVLGHWLAGVWLVVLPVRFFVGLWHDAELVAPGSSTAKAWRIGVSLFAALAVGQILWAGIRGGRLWHFVWPAPLRFVRWLGSPEELPTLWRAVTGYVTGARLPFYFWLGLRGFLGVLLWLVLPVGLLWLAARLDPAKGGGLLAFVGGVLLALVVPHLPFLQARFAVENRFRAFFEVKAVRRLFQRAPMAFLLALLLTLLFALPLYLLKVELPPRELAWLPSLVFVVFIFPARLLTGWALGRALRRERPRHWFFRWTGRLAAVPVVLFYVLLVFANQYLSWNGTLGLFEQHAFLVPAPLMSL